MAKDRKISRRGGVIPELGLDASSANAFPANFLSQNPIFLQTHMAIQIVITRPMLLQMGAYAI